MAEDSNDEDARVYEVEYISEAQIESDRWIYLTKWWGYPVDDSTWEPDSNLASCTELLKSFWNHVGRERKNLKKSRPIRSSKAWRDEQTERTRRLKQTEAESGEPASPTKDPSTADETPQTSKSHLSGSVQDYIRKPVKPKDTETSVDSNKRGNESSVRVTKRTATSSSKPTLSEVRPLKRRRAISDSDSGTSKAATPRSGSKGDEISEDEISSSFLRRKSAPKKSLRLDSSDDDGPSELSENLGNAPSDTAAIHTTEPAVTARSEPDIILSPESVVPPLPVPSAAGPVANTTFEPAVDTPANRDTPVSSASRRVSGSDETPAPATVARSIPPTLHGKTILKPIAPIVDKHRGSRMKILPTPVTQVSSLSTKFSVAGGSVARASSQPKSPVVSTPSIRNVPTEAQAFPSDELSASTSDPPLGLKAQDQMVPLSLGELSSVLSNASTTKTKPARRSALDVTEAMTNLSSNSVPPTFEPTPTPIPAIKENMVRMAKKWVGSLVLGESTYCQINLEPVSASVNEKVMSTVLASLGGQLLATATQPAAAIGHLFSPAFHVPVEFAKVGPADSDNASRLERLLTYMELEQKVSIFHPSPKFPTIYFVLHPSTLAKATLALSTPKAIQNGPPTLALATLVKRLQRGFSSPNLIQSSIHNPAVLLPGDVDIPSYQRIARYFGFTSRLLDYLSGRTFCVFSAYGENKRPAYGSSKDPETLALIRLLTKCGVKCVDSHQSSNFIVFIHSNAWLSSDMPVPDPLLNRGKSYLIQYFKYGTCLNFMPGENRFVCEAFPLGGVLSLTARAMAEDPDGVLDLIDKVGSHPLWQVYLLPETLGLLFHALSDPGISSGAVVTIGGLIVRLRIPESMLAIASCPPQLSSELDVDSILSWREMQSSIADLYDNPPALLDYCANRLRTTYAHLINSPLTQLEAAVENDCIQDLVNLQRQPALYTRHREFVLIVPGRGHNGPGPSKDHGIASYTLEGFIFSDDVNPSKAHALSYD